MSSIGFLSLAHEGLKKSCNVGFLLFILQPLISLLNPLNFPLFLLSHVIYWLLFYFPIKWGMTRLSRSDTDYSHIEQRSFTIALITFVVLYHVMLFLFINCLAVNMEIGAAISASSPLPTVLPESTVLDFGGITNTWAA